MATGNTLYEEKLREKPTLDELFENVNIGTGWYKFGVLLKLEKTKLDAIEELNKDVGFKTLMMFQLWLDTNPNAMRIEIMNTLKKAVIGEVTVAEKYEKILRDSCGITTGEYCKLFYYKNIESVMDKEMSDVDELRLKVNTVINQKTAEIEQLKCRLKQKESNILTHFLCS